MDSRSKRRLPIKFKQTLQIGKRVGIKFLIEKLVRGRSGKKQFGLIRGKEHFFFL